MTAITFEIRCRALSRQGRAIEGTMVAVRAVEKADHFRQEAKFCLEIAERMSAITDRALLVDIAQHWLEMAVKAEAAEPEP